jgi:hypothetical protein
MRNDNATFSVRARPENRVNVYVSGGTVLRHESMAQQRECRPFASDALRWRTAAGASRNRQTFCDPSASGSRGPVAVRVGEMIGVRPSKSTVHGGG